MSDSIPFDDIARIVREARHIDDGVDELLHLARRKVPALLPVWGMLDSLRWADDVPGVLAEWNDRLKTCVPLKTSGIYLGIDGLNMPTGRGIELGCSTAYEGGGSIEYIYRCGTYCRDLPMPSLATFYTWFYGKGGHKTFGEADTNSIEYPICLGASALVLREVFRATDPLLLKGEAKERCFAFGFHDGDMLRLGRAGHGGFDSDATFES